MKRRIIVERGEIGHIAQLMGCTREMVGHSLAFRKDTDLARRIRHLAILRGGVEIGDEPVNNVTNHERISVALPK